MSIQRVHLTESTSSMNQPCACKGRRVCRFCEHDGNKSQPFDLSTKNVYYFCRLCKDRAWSVSAPHDAHTGHWIPISGVTVIENFVTTDTEEYLRRNIDADPWVDSQSGRRKQDYGPKVNFKKHKLNTSPFTGLPLYSKAIVEKLAELEVTSGFVPVELCNLEYTPERGSAIDPHYDDFWLWGERLITLNLLSDTFLLLVRDRLAAVVESGTPNVEKLVASTAQPDKSSSATNEDAAILVHLPARSLVVVHGEARFHWKHGILRQHITCRRLAMTFRELTKEFLPGGDNASVGQEIIDIALGFKGRPVPSST